MHDIKSKETDNLFEAVLTLKTVDECYKFFEDVCTIKEIKAISQRYEVARLLSTGCVYSDIVAQTGASTATISRVNRSIAYGNDGYSLVFARLNKTKGE